MTDFDHRAVITEVEQVAAELTLEDQDRWWQQLDGDNRDYVCSLWQNTVQVGDDNPAGPVGTVHFLAHDPLMPTLAVFSEEARLMLNRLVRLSPDLCPPLEQ